MTWTMAAGRRSDLWHAKTQGRKVGVFIFFKLCIQFSYDFILLVSIGVVQKPCVFASLRDLYAVSMAEAGVVEIARLACDAGEGRELG